MNRAKIYGITINYRLEGPDEGEVVMLSHSLASTMGMWEDQIASLTDAGFRVLGYDSRGHGLSDVPAGPYNIEMLALDAVALIDALGIEKVHFCGLSMGGMVGQLLGSKYQDRLSSLILSSTSAYMPPPHLWNERIESVRNGGMQAVADAAIDRWFTGIGKNKMSEKVGKVKNLILETSPLGFCACCEAIRDMDLRGIIAGIKIPTLVIVGSLDPGTPVSAAQFIYERIPSSRLEVIKDAAHFVNVERSEEFNDLILNFLKDLHVS